MGLLELFPGGRHSVLPVLHLRALLRTRLPADWPRTSDGQSPGLVRLWVHGEY